MTWDLSNFDPNTKNNNLKDSINKEGKELSTKTKRQLSTEELKYQSEPMEIGHSSDNWTNLRPSFTPKLIQTYQNLNFTYLQVQEWANILGNNFNPQDYEFINWLAHTKNLTPEETLNHYNLEDLKEEFEQFQQQTQIIHNPSK